MDKTVTVKIKRVSDSTEFNIGTGYDWKFLKNGLDGFGSFDNDINFVDNGIHDGGIITSSRISKVDRTIKCAYLVLDSNDTQRRKVTAFFNVKDTYKVYITYGGRTLWAEGTIYKYDLSMSADIKARMDLTVTFTFANPYLKSYDDFGSDIASKKNMIAFPYLSSFNVAPYGVTGGVFNFAQKVNLNNDGDVETYCTAIFKASGDVVNPSLIIDGNYVRVIDTMVNGDTIEMDFTALPPTVKKNGVNYIGHCDRTSAFTDMAIKVGDVSVQYSADDGDGNLSVSFYYNKLYASI